MILKVITDYIGSLLRKNLFRTEFIRIYSLRYLHAFRVHTTINAMKLFGTKTEDEVPLMIRNISQGL